MGGKNHYYLTDALGSMVALADETGTKVNTYAYSPRGVQRAGMTEQVHQPYRFAGGYQDPTGLYHFAARYYDPNIGAALWGAGAGGAGATIAGGNQAERENGAIGGLLGGLSGPIGSAIFG